MVHVVVNSVTKIQLGCKYSRMLLRENHRKKEECFPIQMYPFILTIVR